LIANGPAQLALKGKAQKGRHLHFFGKQGHRFAIGTLGTVECRLGGLQQGICVTRMIGHHSQPDARRQGDVLPRHMDRGPHHPQQLMGDGQHFFQITHVGHENAELVRGQAGHLEAGQGAAARGLGGSPVTHALTQAVADDLQHLVPALRPQAVVDACKAVDIHHHHGTPAVVAQAAHGSTQQVLAKELPIGQAGEMVKVGKLTDAALGVHLVGDVLGAAFHDQSGCLVRIAGLHGFEHRAHAAVGPYHPVGQLEADAPAGTVKRRRHQGTVGHIHMLKYGLHLLTEDTGRLPEEPVILVRALDPVFIHEPLPAAETGNALGVGEALLVAGQLLHDLGRTQHVTDAETQQGPVDRLGDEVGGPHIKGALNRVAIIQPSQHDDGNQRPAMPGTQSADRPRSHSARASSHPAARDPAMLHRTGSRPAARLRLQRQ
jgi:hypothetical protein